jgi:hypothetical protein
MRVQQNLMAPGKTGPGLITTVAANPPNVPKNGRRLFARRMGDHHMGTVGMTRQGKITLDLLDHRAALRQQDIGEFE